jgi:hypothetical protein
MRISSFRSHWIQVLSDDGFGLGAGADAAAAGVDPAELAPSFLPSEEWVEPESDGPEAAWSALV